MKAIRFFTYGGPDVMQLDEVPIPDCGPGDLLVRVVAAGINPLDWKLRSGAMAGMRDLSLPFTPGLDAAGVVVALGGAVQGFALEDRVCFYADLGQHGTYAEYVVVPAQQAALIPPEVSFVDAAALPTPGQAAWTALVDMAQIKPGNRVLIHGAAGALGGVAVQLAKQHGAYVVAMASSNSVARVQALGADEVLDYQVDSFGQQLRGMDVVLDTIGGPVQEASWRTLLTGGLLLATSMPPPPGRAEQAGVRAEFVMTRPRGSVLASLLQRQLRVEVARTLPMADAAEAHRLGERGQAGGKMVLLMPPRVL